MHGLGEIKSINAWAYECHKRKVKSKTERKAKLERIKASFSNAAR